MSNLSNPFWTFSLRVYSLEDVRSALLWLQDDVGADVNVLLFAICKACFSSQPVSPQAILDWEHLVQPWREEVVRPIRGVRRYMKQAASLSAFALRGEARAGVAVAELLCEQVQQAELHARFAASDAAEPLQTSVSQISDALALAVSIYGQTASPAVAEAIRRIAESVHREVVHRTGELNFVPT